MRVRAAAVTAVLLLAAGTAACSSEGASAPSSPRQGPAASAEPAAHTGTDGAGKPADLTAEERSAACDKAVAEGDTNAEVCVIDDPELADIGIEAGVPASEGPYLGPGK